MNTPIGKNSLPDDMNTLKVEKLTETAKLPVRAEEGSVGLDVFVDSISIREGALCYNLGIGIEPPAGFFAMLVPRSSLSKVEWVFGNSIGIIDPSYRGELQIRMRPVGTVTLLNEEGIITSTHSKRQDLPYKIGERVGQLIFIPAIFAEVKEETLSKTTRGVGGFGSTGKK